MESNGVLVELSHSYLRVNISLGSAELLSIIEAESMICSYLIVSFIINIDVAEVGIIDLIIAM